MAVREEEGGGPSVRRVDGDGGSGAHVRVSTLATIVSGSEVTSPFTGMPAVIV